MTASIQLARASEGARPLPRRINFTREALAAITCPRDRKAVFVYDAKARQLQYAVRFSGFRGFYWYGRIRGEHQPIRHLIGDEQTPIEHARKVAMKLSVDARDGINPKTVIRKRLADEARESRTLGDLWEQYERDYLSVSARPTTVKGHTSLWRTWVGPWGAKLKVDEVTRPMLREFHATAARGRIRRIEGRARRDLGGKVTANRCVSLIRRLFNFAEIDDHPVKRGAVKLFHVESRERFLTPAEIGRFFAALEQEPNEVFRDFIELALFTGARSGNLRSMRWSELDLVAKQWTIPAEKSKSGKAVTLPLTAPAMAVIERRKQLHALRRIPTPYVLWSDVSECGHIVEARGAIHRACKAAGIQDLRIHDLRRTLGSWQAALGASLPIIGRSLGHSSLTATAIYARINIDPVRASMASAAAAMLAAAAVAQAPEQGKDVPNADLIA